MSNNYGYQGGNYTTTSYGGGGGNEGGGFMNGSQQGSQDSPGQSKTYGQETLRPVTIKQVIDGTLAHSDADFKIDGAEVHQITFVGQINSVSQRAANNLYKVDDGTGITEVMQWINSDIDPSTVEPVAKEGEYVRVYGRMKAFANKRHVVSNSIRPVTDFNEVSYHLLEATAMHLYFTKGPLESGGVKTEQGTGMFVDSYGGNNAAPAQGGKKLPAKISQVGRRVFELLQNSPQNNEGMHVHHIAAQLGVETNNVFKAGDELLGEGLIYTTVDDETWAVLEY